MPSSEPSGESLARTRYRSFGSPRAFARTSARQDSVIDRTIPFGGASTQATSVAASPLRPSARTSATVRSPAAPSGRAANAIAAPVPSANATGRQANARARGPTDAKMDAANLDENDTDEPSYHLPLALVTKWTREPSRAGKRARPGNSVGELPTAIASNAVKSTTYAGISKAQGVLR